MRALKWIGGIAAGLLLLAGGGIVALTLALDAGSFTPRIAAAIEAATGRAATLGAVSLRPGLTPRLSVEGASLANLPGGSRPEMASIRRLEVRVALLPLLGGDVVVEGLDLDGADILLERLADGTPNWVLTPPARPAATAPAGTPAPAADRADASGRSIAFHTIRVRDSRVTLPDPRLGTVSVAAAEITGIGTDRPAKLSAQLALGGVDLGLEGEVSPGLDTIRATLSAGTNRVTVEGQPGATLRIAATLPEPAALRPLLDLMAPGQAAGLPLPPIEANVALDARMQPSDLVLRLGAADVSPFVPGLALTRLEMRAAAPDQPAELTIEASRAGLDIRAQARIETPAALFGPAAAQPLRLTAEIAAAGATATLSGTIARPREATGAAFDLRVAVPDLAALAAVLPDPPPLTDLQLSARIEASGPLTGPLGIPSFRIDSPMLVAEGALTVEPGAPFDVSGRLAAARLDLDGLGERLAQPRAATPAAPSGAAPAPAPAPRAEAGRVIPDIPLPVAAARAYRGTLAVTAREVIAGGMTWRDLRGTLTAAGGHIRLQEASVVTPGGRLTGEAGLNAAGDMPEARIALRSEGRGLDLAALRRARQEATGIEGHAELRIDAQGRGATLRGVAATLTGEAGLAMVGGRLAHAGLQRLGPDLVGLLLPGTPRDGLPLRCVALRISAEDGMASTETLFLETSAGEIQGVAAVNLRTEALAARLLPDITLLGLRVRAPVGIGGTLAAPRVGVEPGRALAQVIGDTVANRLWRSPTIEWLRGRPGAPQGDCAAHLRSARFGADGPVPPAERILPGVPRELQGTAQDVLRGLGGILGGRR